MPPAENEPNEAVLAWFQGLKRLTSDQVQQVDAALVAVGDYGEVHLIVQRGELRYINKVESYKAVKGTNGYKATE